MEFQNNDESIINEPEYVDEEFAEAEEAPDPWVEPPPPRPRAESKTQETGSGERRNLPAMARPFPHRSPAGPAKPEPAADGPSKLRSGPKPHRLPGPEAEPAPRKPRGTSRPPLKKARTAAPEHPKPAAALPSGDPAKANSPPPPRVEPRAPGLKTGGDEARSGSRERVGIPPWHPLAEIIDRFSPFPEGSLILGVDDDGKPLVVSLEDPSLGALLLMGDKAEANRKHLRAILASVEAINAPDLLQVDVVTPSEESFSGMRSHLRRVCAAEEDGVYDLLGEILVSVEERIREKRRLPFQLLVLDEVDALTARLAEESLRFLRWILRRGPQVGIWPVGTVASAQLESLDRKTFHTFGLRLYGQMAGEAASRYAQVPPQVLDALAPGHQGCFKLAEDVISFSIPEIA